MERETTTNYIVGEKTFTFYSSETMWVNRIKKYAEQYPDDVKIIRLHCDDDGVRSVIAELPKKWFNIKPPIKRNITDEQREELRTRLQQAREKSGK